MTNHGTFQVSWRTCPDPIPENEPFDLFALVERTDPPGEPSEDLVLAVNASMPAHRHGMMRQVRTEALGDGQFFVGGMLLHMQGDWRFTFDVAQGPTFDQARFTVPLLPEPARQALEGFDAEEVGRILSMSPLPGVPDDPTNAYDTNEAAAHLGQFLFFDRRLSASGNTSCSTCHVPELDWTDGKPLADLGTPLMRNAMSLWNAAYGRWFFWDGRVDSLWAQALQPLENPLEQDTDRVSIVRVLAGDAQLHRAYTEVFGPLPDLSAPAFPPRAKPNPESPDDPLAVAWAELALPDQAAINRVFANVGKAIAAFERRIVTRASPFDSFVEGLRTGDSPRIAGFPPSALRGLKLFIGKANCHLCHSGPYLSDREFHNNKVPARPELPSDLGRYSGMLLVLKDPFNGLGQFSDGQDPDARDKLQRMPVSGDVWGEFKTPSLRNVARTAPYMHQGQLATLADVVDFYSDRIPEPNPHAHGERVLVPLHLTVGEKADLAAFLESLTDGSLPQELVRPPTSPRLGE